MTASRKKLASVIFKPYIILTTFAMVLFLTVSIGLVRYSVRGVFMDRLYSKQQLFSNHITEDILSGANYEVYRKCNFYSTDRDLISLKVYGMNGELICNMQKRSSDAGLITISTPIYFDEYRTREASSIQATYSFSEILSVFNNAMIMLVASLILLIVFQYFLGRKISVSLSKSISYLSDIMKRGKIDDLIRLSRTKRAMNTIELGELYDGTEYLAGQVVKYQAEILVREKEAVIGNLSLQVAHDIRSPLSSMQAALMMLREQCGDNKDTADSLNLLQLSSKRLDDIANGLLAKYKGEESASQLFSIHEVLDELIGELQASPLGQGTEFKKTYVTSALYVTGDKTGINRAIGNILKNALEAMQQNPSEKPRQLSIATNFDDNQQLTIRIQDSGPGIPNDKIPLILQGGHTEGKTDGHGIGTKVVKEMVETHKGHFSIESQMGTGATFIITLPATIQNDETVLILPNSGNNSIYVIDDEPSIREQWRLTLKAQGIETEMFSCWEDFEKSDPSALPQDDKMATFIIDYHFDNSEVDGLEVIRRLKTRGFSKFVLATAEYWKPAIKDAAQKLGVILCPKPLPKIAISHSPVIQNEKNVGKTVLLIDDDESIRVSWNMLKKKFGIAKLHSFATMEAFIDANINPSNCDLCVIDKNIENSQYNGAQMLAYLKQNGAKTVVLATGEPESDIRNDPDYATIDGIIASKIPENISQF